MRERHVCWQHLGFAMDVVVYHTGGAAHWLEVTNPDNGELLGRRKFQTVDARVRAVAEANEVVRRGT